MSMPMEEQPVIEETQEPVAEEVTSEQEVQYELSEHARNFLGTHEISPEFYPEFEGALKAWDAGAQRKFQEYQQQLEPYKEFGSPDEIRAMRETIRTIQENPEAFYQVLAEQYGQPQPQQQAPKLDLGAEFEDLTPVISQMQQSFEQRFEQQEKAYQSQLARLNQAVTTMSQQLNMFQQQGQEQQVNSQLENQLTLLRVERPNVDHNFIREQVTDKGHSIDEALALWEQAEKAVTAKLKTPTSSPVLSSGGNPPAHNDIDVTDLSNSETKSLVANTLAAMMQQRNG